MLLVVMILVNRGMSAIYFAYGTSGEGIAEGMRLIESVKTLYLLLVSIRVLRRNTKKQKGLYNMSGFEQKTPFEGVFL